MEPTARPADIRQQQAVQAALWECCTHLAKQASRISDLLNEWDTDRNGLIDKKEFRNACAAMGILFPREVIDALFDKFLDESKSKAADSGMLDHHELVLRARRAAFDRGFVPQPAPPNATRRREEREARKHAKSVEEIRMREIERIKEEIEVRQRSLDEHRATVREKFGRKRTEHKKQLLEQQNPYWIRRVRDDKKVAKAEAEAAAAAKDGQLRFLPTISPRAQTIARQTWAKDRVSVRHDEKLESIHDVAKLQDVWVGSIIEMFKQPSTEVKFAEKFKKRRDEARGRAPRSDAFRAITPGLPKPKRSQIDVNAADATATVATEEIPLKPLHSRSTRSPIRSPARSPKPKTPKGEQTAPARQARVRPAPEAEVLRID